MKWIHLDKKWNIRQYVTYYDENVIIIFDSEKKSLKKNSNEVSNQENLFETKRTRFMKFGTLSRG